eukprot:COSAG06_NODE_16361_length_1005_cov_1.633554_2_plen_71_part_00
MQIKAIRRKYKSYVCGVATLKTALQHDGGGLSDRWNRGIQETRQGMNEEAATNQPTGMDRTALQLESSSL